MGINLWDIGAFATGAIERDREHTAENLKIRGDELAAKKNALIQRKNKKYDMEIEAYKKEKGIMDKINSLNAEAAAFNEANKGKLNTAGDEITYDQKLYATRYLLATVDGFKDLDKTERDTMIRGFNKSGANYEMQTKDPDKLAALQSKEEDIILSNYATQLKAAKDDSFLINKILGKKTTDSSSADLEKAVDADVKASEIVTKIDKVENPNKTDGTTISLTESVKVFRPTPMWQTEYAKAFGNTKYDLKGTQVHSFLNTLGVHGGNDELSLKFNKTDSGIDGHNANSSAQVDFMKSMFNQVKNSKTRNVVGAITGGSNHAEVGNVLNTDKVLSEMTSILDQGRSGNIKHDPIGWKGNIRLTTFVPLNVADAQGNLIINGTTVGGLNEAQMKKINGYLNDFIRKQTELRKDKNIDAQGVAVGIYRKLYENKDANMLNSFNAFLLDKDKDLKASYEKVLAASKDTERKTTGETQDIKTPSDDVVITDTKFTLGVNKKNERVIVVPEDGAIPGKKPDGTSFKKGDKISLNKENIEKLKKLNNDEINSLISEGTKFETGMKKAPLVGVKTGTTYEDMQKSTEEMNKEMLSWFSDEANKKRLEEKKKNYKRKR